MTQVVRNRQDAEKAGLGWNVLSQPSGPVAAAFMNDMRPMTFIMGPVGSAKTTSCVGKALNIARLQQPSIVDGVRKVRICIVRSDYRRLWESTIPSFLKVLPKDLGVWVGPKGDPADFKISWHNEATGKVDMQTEFIFRAIGDNNLEEFIKGLEVTAFWLNEVDTLPPECLGYFFQRVGRYLLDELPDPETAIRGVYGDFNAPDEDNWLAVKMEQTHEIVNRGDIDAGYRQPNYLEDLKHIDFTDVGAVTDYVKSGTVFYVQPSGLSPKAENIQNLGRAWYPMQAAQMEDWEVKRFIENRIGFSRLGEPVYRNYNPDLHDLDERHRADPRLPIVVGIDGGGTAAAVVGQRWDYDRLATLDEIITPDDQRTDGFTFGKRVGEFLNAPENGYIKQVDRGDVYATIDQANAKGGFEAGDTFLEAFEAGYAEATGMRLRVVPSETNDPDTRQGAVRRAMGEIADGKPRKMVSKRCKTLRRGYASGYKLRKGKNAAGDIVYQAVKNHYSHVCDADQYLTLYFVGIGADARRASRMSGVGMRAGAPAKPAKIIHHTAL